MAQAWKYFIVEVTYRYPVEQLADTVPQHRAFLAGGYEQGWLLLSGPQVPPLGGMLVGRAPSLEALQAFIACDPYQVKGLADYRFVEFNPVLRASIVEDWASGT